MTRSSEAEATADDSGNLVDLDRFNPGAQLFVRARASSDAAETNISRMIFGEGALSDVRGINISYDGQLMVFAARGPYDDTVAEDEEQPSVWNLYEYNFASGEVYPIMNAGDAALGHDITPHYLADGRIIFSSSRQQRTGTILLDEGKPQYAYQVEVDDEDERYGPGFALHIAEFDGNRNLTAIEQVTFNLSHDFDPVLLPSGKVVFSRWDAQNNRDQVSFYRMNPDGSQLEIVFGYRSQEAMAAVLRGQFASAYGSNEVFDAFYTANTAFQFSKPRIFPGQDQLIAVLRPFDDVNLSGDEDNPELIDPVETLVSIDINNFVDVGTPLDSSSQTGSGVSLLDLVAPENQDVIFPDGRVSAITRLADGTNRAIISLSICRILNDDNTVRSCRGVDLDDEDIQEAPPNYGLWLYDFDRNTQIPLVLGDGDQEPYTEIFLVQSRDRPVSIPDTPVVVPTDNDETCDPAYFAEEDGFGMIHIRSVYDLDGSFNTSWAPDGVTTISQLRDPVNYSADQRSARFVRFEKPVYNIDPDFKEIPGNFSANSGPFMREILGYAPVQPDGSVKVKVPADVPLMLSVVDRYGRRLDGSTDHMNWMQVRPGEVRECNGCHSANSNYPHGRTDAQAASLNSGAISMSMFPNTNAQAYEVDISVAQDGSATQTCLPLAGETMAEVYVRTDTSRAELIPDIVFQDVWTDPAQRAPDESFAHRFNTIRSVYDAGVGLGDATRGALPFNRGECIDDWNAFCRTVINYETHIQPLWDVSRIINTEDGTVTYSCVDCHGNVNPEDGTAQIPAGQLSLSGETVDDVLVSHDDLLAGNDFVQIDQGDGTFVEADQLDAQDAEGNVIPELEKQANGNYCYRWVDNRLITPEINAVQTEFVDVLDEEGEVIGQEEVNVLDDDGDPIPLRFSIIERSLGLGVGLARSDARNSNQFRGLFEPGFRFSNTSCGGTTSRGGAPEFDHEGILSESELKLIWEWLDIGSAYYNNPFDVPD